MATDRERREVAALKAEQEAQAQASAQLAAELAAVAAVLIAALLRGASPDVLRTLVRRMLSELVPSARSALEVARARGLDLGQGQLSSTDRPTGPPLHDGVLQRVIDTSDSRAGAHLDEAIVLSTQLPMTDQADVMAVIGKAQAAVRTQRTDAAWVTHRGIALGVAEVARESGLNVVWIAERNACLNCLAYAGRVVRPGAPFPPGLTYADKALVQLGPLLGPPLHPNCRCQLELTDLEPGDIDVALAREAARSVARGLTDHASEPARFRAADRLVKSATTLLPKSVIDRARRNLRDGAFKARPGSPEAAAEIARRNQARAARGPVVRPAPPVTGREAAEALMMDALEQGPARAGLLRYTGGEYEGINRRTRAGTPTEEDREVLDQLTALARPLPFAITVYRGGARPGTDPAPISTSLSPSRARSFGDVVAILIPAGTPVIPVSQLQRGENYRWGAPGNEEEILLPPGTTLKMVNGVLTVAT